MDELETGLHDAQIAVMGDPANPANWCKLGAMHHVLASSGPDHYMEAHLAFERAINMDASSAEASLGFSASCYTIGALPFALELAKKAEWLATFHGQPEIAKRGQLAAGGIHLKMGNWEEGWRYAEARPAPAPPLSVALTDIKDKPVLVRAEQGFGDNIQFMRYLPILSGYCSRVKLDVPPALRSLCRSFLPYVEVLDEPEELEISLNMCSLPLLLGPVIGWEPIPPGWLPRNLAPNTHASFLGVCRASLAPSPTTFRKNPLPCEWKAFQDSLPEIPLGLMEQDLGAHNWLETARALRDCKMVISVDTAVAHLAATMGIETWLLQRFDSCWRWDHPNWYPSVRIFQQTALGDWGSVFRQVKEALAAR